MRRGIATLIDWAISFLLGIFVMLPLNSDAAETGHRASIVTMVVIFAAIMFAYGAFFDAIAGTTPGRLVARLRVRMASGERCGVRAALVRNVTKAMCGTAMAFFGFAVWSVFDWLGHRNDLFHSTIIWSRAVPFLIVGPAGLLLTTIFIMRSPDRLRLGDRIAGTVVLRSREVHRRPVAATP